MTSLPRATVRLSLENALHIILCLGLFAMFVAFALWPAYRRHDELSNRACLLQGRIAERSVLLPFSAEMDAALSESESAALYMPVPVPLDRGEFGAIHALLKELVEGSGLKLLQVTPHANSLRDGRRFLGVNVSAEGALLDMRGFLQAVMQMPCFYHLERLRISEGAETEQIETQVWLSVKANGNGDRG